MFTIKIGPDGSQSYSLDPSWIPLLVKWFGFGVEPSLNYSTAHAQAAYPGDVSGFLRIGNGGTEVRAPYTTLIDYRDFAADSLGNFRSVGRFHLPGELALLRDAEIKRRKSVGLLKKGDRPAVRMSALNSTPGTLPEFELEEATYYDQVGSNLSVDAILPSQLSVDGRFCKTARDWDKAQSASVASLPALPLSRLSNTIGVAVGVRAIDRHGRPGFVVRKRAPDVDVYPNMWHVPFSFALSYTPPLPQSGQLENLIRFDYAQELLQETGLELDEIKYLRPLALCRDMCRAGKPQFFFELESSLSYEDLDRRMKKHNDEYRGSSRLVSLGKAPDFIHEQGSPELLAYLCLHCA